MWMRTLGYDDRPHSLLFRARGRIAFISETCTEEGARRNAHDRHRCFAPRIVLGLMSGTHPQRTPVPAPTLAFSSIALGWLAILAAFSGENWPSGQRAPQYQPSREGSKGVGLGSAGRAY